MRARGPILLSFFTIPMAHTWHRLNCPRMENVTLIAKGLMDARLDRVDQKGRLGSEDLHSRHLTLSHI